MSEYTYKEYLKRKSRQHARKLMLITFLAMPSEVHFVNLEAKKRFDLITRRLLK